MGFGGQLCQIINYKAGTWAPSKRSLCFQASETKRLAALWKVCLSTTTTATAKTTMVQARQSLTREEAGLAVDWFACLDTLDLSRERQAWSFQLATLGWLFMFSWILFFGLASLVFVEEKREKIIVPLSQSRTRAFEHSEPSIHLGKLWIGVPENVNARGDLSTD